MQPESFKGTLLPENTTTLSLPTLLAKVELMSVAPPFVLGKLGLVERDTLRLPMDPLMALPGLARKEIALIVIGLE